MSDELEGGPGWQVDRATLRPRITDLEVFRADRTDDPYGAELERLWGEDPAGAEQMLRQCPQDFRTRALLADALSAQGRHDEGVAAWRELFDENRTPARATYLQHHLGCALLAAGRTGEAVDMLRLALLGRAVGSPRALATTQHALRVAQSRRGA